MKLVILLCSIAVINMASTPDLAKLTVSSPVFRQNGIIPALYTCEGTNVNPPLRIKGIPHGTQTLALIMDDPDAPNGTFTHWVMWNISSRGVITENSLTGTNGKNSKQENTYTGPCPPTGTHHYYFRVYALDIKLNLSANTDKDALLKAIEGHIIGSGELIGKYELTQQK